MSPDRYRVTQSSVVADQFRRVTELAGHQGRLPITLAAARWVLEELARTPYEFGESRYHLHRIGIDIRVGFARPLFVEYGIDPVHRMVYFRRFVLVKG